MSPANGIPANLRPRKTPRYRVAKPAFGERKTALVAALALAIGGTAFGAGAATSPALMRVNGGLAGKQARAAALRAHFIARHGALPAAPRRAAATLSVSNCDDSGAGSLRAAVTSAVSGDTIDLTGLDCGTIALTSGALASDVDYLTLNGPGADKLVIDAGHHSRVIALLGTAGALTIDGLTLRNGSYTNQDPDDPSGAAPGGCVLAAQYATISNSSLEHCSASGKSVQGAAVHATGALWLVDSTVSGSIATASADDISATINGGAVSAGAVYMTDSQVSGATVTATTTSSYGGVFGGGVFGMYGVILTDSSVSGVDVHVSAARDAYAKGGGVGSPTTVILERASVADNAVHGTPGTGYYQGATSISAIGGGIYIMAIPRTHPEPSTVTDSTISGNAALCDGACGTYTVGGGGGLGTWAPEAVAITNSTISGNRTDLNGGGLYTRAGGSVRLVNSTVTDNRSDHGAGIADLAPNAPAWLEAESTLVADNHPVDGADAVQVVTVHDGISGSHDLIGTANVALPADTLTGAPLLAPLADNGGPTRTHALLPGSPAIDAGSNPLALTADQRGADHVRMYGNAPDIGAYESQPLADAIFSSGFE